MIMKNIHVLPTPNPSRLMIDTIENKLYLQPILHDKTVNFLTQNIYITNYEEIKEGEWVYGLFNGGVVIKSEFDVPKNSQYYKEYGLKIILTTDVDLIKDGVQAIDDEFLEWFVQNPSCEEVEVKKECCGQCDERLCEVNDLGRKETKENTFYKIIIPKEEPKTAWVGVLHDKLNEYYPAEYELKDIYQGEGCLPNFPNEELCQIWCDSKYKEDPNYNMKQEILDEMKKQETLEEGFYRIRKSIDYEEFDFTSFELGAKWQQENSYSGEDMKQFGDWCRNGLLNTEYGLEKLDEHLEQWKQFKKK